MATEPVPATTAHPAPTVEELIRHRLSTALGGWRGSVETALPMVAFVAVWTWRKDVMTAVVTAGVVTVLLAGFRLVQRQSLQFVLSAVFATAIAAFFALRSGKAEDAFLPGILASCAWGVANPAVRAAQVAGGRVHGRRGRSRAWPRTRSRGAATAVWSACASG